MKWHLTVHEAAVHELNEAADFYDLECPGLGTAFLDALERAVEAVQRNPEAAQRLRGPVRRKPLLRFPYTLIYSVVDDELRILAVAHQKRRPFYWRARR